ncbi:MAG: NADH-quinone oxidoreductase subunit H [Polyangiaceae bacterium]|nr:NADH-quinone oxidoreductase subunit H [Polyangiaceae bacterium]
MNSPGTSFGWVEVVLTILKILLIVGFCLNFSAIAVWADRRQSAMIQHRVGPNRAVVNVPSFIIQGILTAPGILLGALAALGLGQALTPQAAIERMGVSLQLIVFVAWFNLVLLSWRVSRKGALNAFEAAVGSNLPRAYFYAGLAGHVVVALVSVAVARQVSAGQIASDKAYLAARVASVVLGGLMGASGVYAAMRIPKGPVGIRLAGTLHGIADALKMMFKEDFIPKNADRLLHALGPMIALFPALVVMAVVPFGEQLCFQDVNKNGSFEFAELLRVKGAMARDAVCEGHSVPLQIVDMNVGILYIFAISSTGVIGAAIAGWASDNKFSLLGGLRAASQMVSYEVAMGLSLMGVLLIYSSLRFTPMVSWQNMYAWGIFVQPIAFFMFLAASMAENKRVPFDQPEGESEIVAGYFVEYSGFKFGMFMAGEYVEIFTGAAIMVTLFFGGYTMPFLFADGIDVTIGETTFFAYKMNHLAVTVIQALAFFGKSVFLSWVIIFFRWTLPRFRYDQVMRFGWTKLLPLAIGNLAVTAVAVVAIDAAGPGLHSTLKLLGQLSHALVAGAMLVLPVGLVWLFLRPVESTRFLRSSSARFAAAAGGVKPTPMQA